MNFQRLLFAVLVSQAIALGAAAAEVDPHELSDRKIDVVLHWEAIAESARQALIDHWRSDLIADPGERFEATDVVTPDARLPARRLVFAAETPHAWFVCYEKGGIAHSFLLAALPRRNGSVDAANLRIFLLAHEVHDIDAVRALVAAHGYREAAAVD